MQYSFANLLKVNAIILYANRKIKKFHIKFGPKNNFVDTDKGDFWKLINFGQNLYAIKIDSLKF